MAPIPFRGFDERAPIRIYSLGLLPHWRQDDCTYFVTFRLADSLPRKFHEEWREQRDEAFRTLGVGSWEEARLSLPQEQWRNLEYKLRRSLETCLDSGMGECVLRNPQNAQIMAEALMHFHGTRVLTGDFVVMPNHVHALLRPLPGHELEEVLQSVKGYSARAIHREANRAGRFWQKESYDHIVRDSGSLIRFQQYIRQNPVRACLPCGAFRLFTSTFDISQD